SSTRRTRVAFTSQTNSVLGEEDVPAPEGVEILYLGQRVENLARSVLTVWNNGNVTIDRSQLVAMKPIGIHFSKAQKILDFRIVKASRAESNFKLEKHTDEHAGDSLRIDFDFVEPNEGILLEMLHTGF